MSVTNKTPGEEYWNPYFRKAIIFATNQPDELTLSIETVTDPKSLVSEAVKEMAEDANFVRQGVLSALYYEPGLVKQTPGGERFIKFTRNTDLLMRIAGLTRQDKTLYSPDLSKLSLQLTASLDDIFGKISTMKNHPRTRNGHDEIRWTRPDLTELLSMANDNIMLLKQAFVQREVAELLDSLTYAEKTVGQMTQICQNFLSAITKGATTGRAATSAPVMESGSEDEGSDEDSESSETAPIIKRITALAGSSSMRASDSTISRLQLVNRDTANTSGDLKEVTANSESSSKDKYALVTRGPSGSAAGSSRRSSERKNKGIADGTHRRKQGTSRRSDRSQDRDDLALAIRGSAGDSAVSSRQRSPERKKKGSEDASGRRRRRSGDRSSRR